MLGNRCLPPIYGIKFVLLYAVMISASISTLYNVNAVNDTDIEVRLTGNNAHMGRVQVRYSVNDSWIPVCSRNNSQLSMTDEWDQNEVNVACKQMGYRGGWFKEYGRGQVPERYIAHLQCEGDELSLGECNHYSSPYETGTGCGNSQYAGASCYSRDYRPGYLGCFTDSHKRVLPDHPLTGPTIGYKWISSNMSVSLCIERCYSLDLRFAGLEARDQCFCGKESAKYDSFGRLADNSCAQPCIGNPDEDCGGEYILSIYDVKKARSNGVCTDPGVPEDGFRFDTNITSAELFGITPTTYNNMTTSNQTTNSSAPTIPFTSTSSASTSPSSGSSTTASSSAFISPSASTVSWNVTVDTNDTLQTNITYNFQSFVYFVCGLGYELVGVSSLQCVVGSTPDQVTWNGTLPTCYLPTTLAPTTIPTTTMTPMITTTTPLSMSTTLPTLPILQIAKSTGEGTLIGVILGSLLLLALFIIIAALWIRHRKKKTSPHPILTPRGGIGAEASTSTSVEPRRLDEEDPENGNMEMTEANSNETYESAVDETIGGGFEEEIDLENYPETYADENAEVEEEDYDEDDGERRGLDDDGNEYENEVEYETGYDNEGVEGSGEYEEGNNNRTNSGYEDYGDEAELIDDGNGNRR